MTIILLNSLLVAIGVTLLMAIAINSFEGGKLFKEVVVNEELPDGTTERVVRKKISLASFKKITSGGWMKAILYGFSLGLALYVTLMLNEAKVPDLGVVSTTLMVIAIVAIWIFQIAFMYEVLSMWKKNGDGWLELLCFIGVAYCWFRSVWALAQLTARFLPGDFLRSLVGNAIPLMGLVAAIGWLIIFMCYFRYRENDKARRREVADAYHLVGILLIFLVTGTLIYILLNTVEWVNFNKPARATGSAGDVKVVLATTMSQEEKDKKADDAVRQIILIPANVDRTDVENFYAKHSTKLMTNTWPTVACTRKDNSAFLLDGKGLYGAVEFPVDVAFCRSADYAHDHEGGYTEEELEAIQYWIEERLLSGKLSNREREAILNWIVERIARDPIYGHMWAQALAELHSWSGKSVREMYPWLDNFLNDWENGKRLEYYTTRYEGKDGIYVNDEWQPIAYAIAMTIERLTVVNVDTPTAYHFRMEDFIESPSKATTVKADDMESKAAAVLAAFDKNEEVFKERLALNLYDGRAEVIPKPKRVDPEVPTPTTVPETSPDPTTTPVPTMPVPTTPVPTTPVPTTPVPTTPTPTDPTTQPYTKDISKGVTDPAKVTQPVDTTGPGTRNTESSLTPPSTAYPQPTEPPTTSAPTTEYVEPTLPTHEEETTAVPPTTVDSRESSEIWSQDPTEPPVNYTEPGNPTTGPITTSPGVPWGGPSD